MVEEKEEGKEETEQSVEEEEKKKKKKQKGKKTKKEKKSQKERPKSKKKHAKVQVWKLYDVKGTDISRKGEFCPRCGAGTFLAVYKNRKYCGKCGYAQMQETVKT